MPENHYDVIIVGGRCAGASLAIRLGGAGLRVLLLDRAKFPSLPSVPTSPFIQPSTMRLMDELGIAEAEYQPEGARMDYIALAFADYFHAIMPVAQVNLDRNHFCGIDRNLFDHALWKHASSAEGVTAHQGFSVTEILKNEAGAVMGITGKGDGGTSETFTADLVVGADGRFSPCARQFGAKTTEERNEYTTASYHAEWENVEDYAPNMPSVGTMYNTGKHFLVLSFPIAKRKYIIGTYMKASDAHFGNQGVEQAYLEGLQRVPHLANRLKNAKRVTDVVGVRPIENGYREAFGDGWALVGDAVHYKDPSDGQGIYDALLEAKLLAESILAWKKKGTPWATAGATYQAQMIAATHPVFEQTVKNVKQNVYTAVPPIILKTLVRWSATDPEYQTNFLRYLSRALDISTNKGALNPTPKMILRGIGRDIRNLFKRNSTQTNQ